MLRLFLTHPVFNPKGILDMFNDETSLDIIFDGLNSILLSTKYFLSECFFKNNEILLK